MNPIHNKTRRGTSLVSTMIFGVIVIIGALAFTSMSVIQKNQQSAQQVALSGRKILKEATSRLKAKPGEFPVIRISNSAITGLGVAPPMSRLNMSYIFCYDRNGTQVPNTNGNYNAVATIVDNRDVTTSNECPSASGNPFLPGPGIKIGGSQLCVTTGTVSESFRLSNYCPAGQSEYEVQITPFGSDWGPVDTNWYNVWVINTSSEENKRKRGIIRHFFRESVYIGVPI
jgi:hypothetical protein